MAAPLHLLPAFSYRPINKLLQVEKNGFYLCRRDAMTNARDNEKCTIAVK